MYVYTHTHALTHRERNWDKPPFPKSKLKTCLNHSHLKRTGLTSTQWWGRTGFQKARKLDCLRCI